MSLRVRRYTLTLMWFLRDALLRHWWTASAICLLGFASDGLRIVAILTAIAFASAGASGEQIEALGYTIDPGASIRTVLIVATVVAVFFLTASISQYAERRLTYRIWGIHAECLARRALCTLAQPGMVGRPETSTTDPGSFQRVVNGYSNTTGRVLSIVTGIPAPAIMLAVTMGTMLLMSPLTTLAIAVVLAITSPAHAYVSIRAARASRRSAALAPGHSDALRRISSDAMTGRKAGGEIPDIVDESFGAGPIRDYRDAYIRRFLCFAESELLIGAMSAVTVFVLVAGLGWWALTHESSWVLLINYLVLLRFSLGSIATLTKRLAGVHRFYPEVASYYDFDRVRRGRDPLGQHIQAHDPDDTRDD